jgi:putative membrane protein insertion efficiency factor
VTELAVTDPAVTGHDGTGAHDCDGGYVDLPGHSRVQRLMLRAIHAYQRAFQGRPSPCRFFPSCSEYSAEAIHLHGARRGLWLSVRRLARCRPLGPSGFDPVPPPSHHHLEH